MHLKTKVVTALVIGASVIGLAQSSVTLTWKPNSEPDLSHYVIAVYDNGSNLVRNLETTQTILEVTDLDPAVTYSFGAFAVNSSNLWSIESNRIYVRGGVAVPPPDELPTPTGYTANPQ